MKSKAIIDTDNDIDDFVKHLGITRYRGLFLIPVPQGDHPEESIQQ